MRVLISGSSGLIGRGLVKSLTALGHEVVRLVRRPVSDIEPDICLGSGRGAPRSGGHRGLRRGRPPGGRQCRLRPLDDREEGAHPHQPRRRHPAIGRDDRRARCPAQGLRLGLGCGLLRRPWRRGTRRDQRVGQRLLARGLPPVGGRRAARRGQGGAAGLAAHGRGLGPARRGADAHAARVSRTGWAVASAAAGRSSVGSRGPTSSPRSNACWKTKRFLARSTSPRPAR